MLQGRRGNTGAQHSCCFSSPVCFGASASGLSKKSQAPKKGVRVTTDHLTGARASGSEIPVARVSVAPPALTTDGIRSSSLNLSAGPRTSEMYYSIELLRSLAWTVCWRIGIILLRQGVRRQPPRRIRQDTSVEGVWMQKTQLDCLEVAALHG